MAGNKKAPHIIKGALSTDERGTVRFVNDFLFKKIKRFYQIESVKTGIVRAFHGHMKESKYAYVAAGSALVCAARLTDPKKPSKKIKVARFFLSSAKPSVLVIPSGFANGFKTLSPNTIVQFFSTSSLEESLKDDFRFPPDYWGQKIWNHKK